MVNVVETAPWASPDNDVQLSQEELDTLAKMKTGLAFDDIIGNMTVQEKEPKGDESALEATKQDTQLEKTQELAKWLKGPDERRRGLTAIYGEDTVKDMTDADVEAFISEKIGNTPVVASGETEHASHNAALPEGFVDYNLDDLEAQFREDKALESIHQEAGRRLGFGWVKGAGVYANYHAFRAGLKERRQEQMNKKTQGMSATERENYLAASSKRRSLLRKVAAGAVFAALVGLAGFKIKSGFDGGSGGGGNNNDINLTSGGGDSGNGNGNREGHIGGVPGAGEVQASDSETLNLYSNGDPSFYDYDHKTFRGDFGPALAGSDKDGVMGFGFEDWMARNKHEPNGLGNLISGLKLDGKGDSLADRNAFADFLDGNRAEHQRYDEMVQNALRDPSQFKVETVDITSPYDTTYMVDGNGDPVIATQQGVNQGGTAYKITSVKTGEVSLWRKECGAYQQIWLREDLVVQDTPGTSSAAVGNGQPASNNLVGHRPWQGNGGSNPQQPNNPATGGGNPQQPNNPQPEQPGGEQPGGEQPGGEIPGGEEPGGEIPDEDKIWTGGVGTGDGINPAANERIGGTEDPIETGNGTDSENLTTGPWTGGQSTTPLDGALPNANPQQDIVQPGLDAGWKPSDLGQADQGAADTTGNVIDTQMGKPGAQDSALDDAVAGMGANGRPLGSGGGSGTGLGSPGSLGSGAGSGLGSNSLGGGTGGLGALSGAGSGLGSGLGAPK